MSATAPLIENLVAENADNTATGLINKPLPTHSPNVGHRRQQQGSRWNRSRFNGEEAEPLGPLANLVDLMLVFACGLVVALIAMSDQLREQLVTQHPTEQTIERGEELPTLPDNANSSGSGMTAVGTVYRDPQTGKLILVSE